MTALANAQGELVDEVFELLKKSGALCISQIAVMLGVPAGQVERAIRMLERERLVSPRTDRDPSRRFEELEKPYDIIRLF